MTASDVALASEAWEALLRRHVRRRGIRRRATLTESGWRGAAPLWSCTQVLHAGVLLRRAGAAAPGLDDLVAMLPAYRRGTAYAARPGEPDRYYDDGAWLALADEAARRLLGHPLLPGVARDQLDDWLIGGRDDDGGVRWREGDPGRHAVSTGAVALVLARRCERQPQRALRAAADAASSFLSERLADDRGLVRDRLLPGGGTEPTTWSYNQGLAVALEVARHRLGAPDALDRARAYGAAGVERFGGDAGWAQPVAFHAMWCRGLTVLAAHDADPRWPEHVAAYARALSSLPRLADGDLAGRGAMPDPGRYEPRRSDALDLAAAIQVLLLATLPGRDPGAAADVC